MSNYPIDEHERILAVYQERTEQAAKAELFFGYEDLAHMYRVHERYQETLCLLRNEGYRSLESLRILDVGCGNGTMLRQFLHWGADPQKVAGIELRTEPVHEALRINPSLDIRCGSATHLPWPDGTFNLVCQHTMFTSILDLAMRKQVAAEMERVLRNHGAILWYDFRYDNPRNSSVRGIQTKEVQSLFPGFECKIKQITLAPPIARRLPAYALPLLYPWLSSIQFLRTHLLGLLIKR